MRQLHFNEIQQISGGADSFLLQVDMELPLEFYPLLDNIFTEISTKDALNGTQFFTPIVNSGFNLENINFTYFRIAKPA